MTSQPPPSGKRPRAISEGPPLRGLPSIEAARRDRRAKVPPKFWGWAAVFIGAGIVVWWKVEEGDIRRLRGELLGRQRAVVETLGPRWFPLRDKIERWTVECAAPKLTEQTADLAHGWDFRKLSGIYLRLAQERATGPEAIRAAASQSLHDGFTSCLLLVDNPNPLAGSKCETTEQCPRGQLCNDYQHCAAYSQPYNLRLAYRTMRVMTPEWVEEIQAITKKIIMRGAVATFDAIDKYDLPVAAELLQRAKYFMVVIDEPAVGGEPEPAPVGADGGVTDDRSIPSGPHQARVCVWRIEDGKRMLAVRREAAARLVGGAGAGDSAGSVALRQQANSCGLALGVREAMGAEGTAVAPP